MAYWETSSFQFVAAISESDRVSGYRPAFTGRHDVRQRTHLKRKDADYAGYRRRDAGLRTGAVFNASLIEIFTRLTDYTLGVLLGVCAAAVWVTYGVAQKVLLRRLTSQQILFLLYVLCVLSITPFARPAVILQLNGWQLICLLFCGANTLIGYGALAEAMARWQAAQVSAVITLTPLFTLLFPACWHGLGQRFCRAAAECCGVYWGVRGRCGAMFSAIGHRFSPEERIPLR